MTRPRAKIDPVELEKLCGMEGTDGEIGAWFGISTRMVERRRASSKFRDVMEQAKAKGRVSVRRNLFRLANAGNVAAAIFLAKNLLGYRDVLRNEHTGVEGGPVQFSIVEALQQRRNRLAEQRKLTVTAIDCPASPQEEQA